MLMWAACSLLLKARVFSTDENNTRDQLRSNVNRLRLCCRLQIHRHSICRVHCCVLLRFWSQDKPPYQRLPYLCVADGASDRKPMFNPCTMDPSRLHPSDRSRGSAFRPQAMIPTIRDQGLTNSTRASGTEPHPDLKHRSSAAYC